MITRSGVKRYILPTPTSWGSRLCCCCWQVIPNVIARRWANRLQPCNFFTSYSFLINSSLLKKESSLRFWHWSWIELQNWFRFLCMHLCCHGIFMNRHLAVYIAEEPNWKNIHPLKSSIDRLYQVLAKSYTSTACLVFSKIYPHLSIKILWHS